MGRFTWVASLLIWSSRVAYPEWRAIGGHLGVSAIAEPSRRYGGADEGCSVWGRSCDRGLGGEAQGCAVAGLQAAFSDDMYIGPLQSSTRERRKGTSSAFVIKDEAEFGLSLAAIPSGME